MHLHKTARLFASASLFALTACSGGGGGGAAPNTGTPAAPSSPQTLVRFGTVGVGNAGNAPTLATGTTPNFTTNLPPAGTSFALTQTGLNITRTSSPSAIPPNTINISGIPGVGGTATFEGKITSGGITYPVIGLNIPGLNINATGLKGDGTIVTQADGSKVGAVVTGMTYTLLGAWTYQSANGNNNAFGLAVTGYQMPNASVPTTGTASYIGNSSTGAAAGGVVGTVIIKSGSEDIAAATLSGNVNLNVNFATRDASGTLTNMTAKDVISGVTSPWNNVTLTGTLSGTNFSYDTPGAYLVGTAQAQAAPAGATFGMATSSYGPLQGALYGPNANEVGAGWSINDNGRMAVGIFGATKQ